MPDHQAVPRRKCFGLTCAQRCGQLDDVIRLELAAQCAQQLHGERAGAGAEFPQRGGVAGLQRLCHLHRQHLAEQRGHFRCGHEVATRRRHGAELAAVVGVVAQAGLIQGDRHETVEGQPTTLRLNGTVNPVAQLPR
jgi:hypothetical protein